MATTRLSDVIVPAVFTAYAIQRTMELSALAASGIIAPDAQLNALASGPSNLFQMPFWNDLGNGDSNVGSDDPEVLATPDKIGANKDAAQKHLRNKSWSAMDLTGILAGSKPMTAIGDLIGAYWARDLQRTLIATLKGVVADNIAANSGDMVVNVALTADGTPAAVNKIGPMPILAAKQTMGDAAESLVAIAMHSALYTELQRQNLITFIPNSVGVVAIPTYLGYRVIVDDGCPVVVAGNRLEYTSYLFGAGAVGYGEGTPETPTAVTRVEAAGNGEGMETLHNRKHFILHPRGIKWTQSSMAGQAPTNAELAAAANWERVYSRKNVRFAAIVTNG